MAFGQPSKYRHAGNSRVSDYITMAGIIIPMEGHINMPMNRVCTGMNLRYPENGVIKRSISYLRDR